MPYQNKRYHLNEVSPGMELGKVVLTDDGKVALGEGTVLTVGLIEKLYLWGVSTVFVRQKLPDQSPPWQKAIDSPIQKQFFGDYFGTVDTVKTTFSSMRLGREMPLAEMKEIAQSAVAPLIASVGVMNHLHMVRRQDDYTFHHSLNVAIIVGVLGKWLGYAGSDLQELILTGLLHDVGKTQIPFEILNKPGKLNHDEMEIMRLHTTRGYQLVRNTKGIGLSVLSGILQHHERMDGTGYPLQMKGEKIHPFARIIAIADIYDAMTSDRVYHRKVTPFTVVEMLMEEMFGKLDPAMCTIFLHNVRDYFLGNIVQLSDGREAEVIYMGQFIASRPVVRAADGELIDLEKRKDYTIVNLIRT